MTRNAQQTIKSKRKEIDSLTIGLAKIPPQDHSIEMAVLGGMIIQSECVFTVMEIIFDKTVFYREANGMIFSAIQELFKNDSKIDLLTIIDKLRKDSNLEKIGGQGYLIELTNSVNSASNVEYHCRILQEYWMRRKLIEGAYQLAEQAYDLTTDVFDIMLENSKVLEDCSSVLSDKQEKTVKDIVVEVVSDMQEAKNNGGISGIQSGLSEVDKVTGGWQKNNLIIFAGRPGMGKTTLALQCAKNSYAKFGEPVAFFSLEMSSKDLVKKIIASEVSLTTSQITKGSYADYHIHEIFIRSALKSDKLIIDDTAGLNIMHFKAKASKMVRRHKVKLIVIDYLQLMTGNGGNREQEISNISRSLKIVAKTLDIPIIALSQLSRSVETRGGDKRPQLSDLRESGAIEQDADVVVFTYRPEYYKIEQDELGNSTENRMEIIFGKNRNGGTPSVWVESIMASSQIHDIPTILAPFNVKTETKKQIQSLDCEGNITYQIDDQTSDILKSINGSNYFE